MLPPRMKALLVVTVGVKAKAMLLLLMMVLWLLALLACMLKQRSLWRYVV